jgi:hypothetical protein
LNFDFDVYIYNNSTSTSSSVNKTNPLEENNEEEEEDDEEEEEEEEENNITIEEFSVCFFNVVLLYNYNKIYIFAIIIIFLLNGCGGCED